MSSFKLFSHEIEQSIDCGKPWSGFNFLWVGVVQDDLGLMFYYNGTFDFGDQP